MSRYTIAWIGMIVAGSLASAAEPSGDGDGVPPALVASPRPLTAADRSLLPVADLPVVVGNSTWPAISVGSSPTTTSLSNPMGATQGSALTAMQDATPRTAPLGPYLDLDSYLTTPGAPVPDNDVWDWQLMPSSLIYRSYLAGVKESRFASQHVNVNDQGWVWDATLGTRIGLLRYGDHDPVLPDGFQIDAEGAAQVRLDIPDDVNVRSVDFRAGVPLTYGYGRYRTKFGYYHLSSHLGDEFLLGNPNYPRLNYSRDALVLGETIYLTDRLRVYGEVAWAFHNDVNKPWEFQFGIDWAPNEPTGLRGAPFFAINGHLRQELNYSGNFVVETGWCWVADENARLLRIGFIYFNGHSNQFSFYANFEQQIGMAVWYDF